MDVAELGGPSRVGQDEMVATEAEVQANVAGTAARQTRASRLHVRWP
jgi:hypothetical protein